MSNYSILTAFQKHLASRDTPPSTSRNNNNTINKAFDEGVITSKNALPPNAKLLPLIHTHNNQPCPISIENEKKLTNAERLVSQAENTHNVELDKVNTYLQQERNKLTRIQDDYKEFLKEEPKDTQDYMNKIETTFAQKLAPITENLGNVTSELLHVLNQTNVPEQIRQRVRPNQRKWDKTALHELQRDPQFVQVWLPSLQEQFNQDLDTINRSISNLQQSQQQQRDKNNVSAQRLQQEKGIYDHKCEQVVRERDNKLQDVKEQFTSRKKDVNSQWNKIQTDLNKARNELSQREDDLNNAQDRLKHIESDPQLHLSNNIWLQRKADAEIEVKNAENKLKAFKTVAQQELTALEKTNNEALQNYKNKIAVECDNLDRLTSERIKEVSYNKANTSIELLFGQRSFLPILTTEEVLLPVIKPFIGQSMESYLLPQVVNMPVENDYYSRDGDIASRYQPHVNLSPVPQASTQIQHSLSVPKIKMVETEHIVMQDQVIQKPVTDVVMKTVQEYVETPTQTFHAPVNIQMPSLESMNKTSSSTTTTTTSKHSTNTTSSR